MQVSIYLKEDLVKKVDRLAKREQRSRSRVIEILVESSLTKSGESSRFEPLVGAWKDKRSAREIIKEVFANRQRNQRSNRVAL